MKCDKCGKEAHVNLKFIVNGNSYDIHLCKDCVKKYTNLPEGADENSINYDAINIDPKELESLIQKFVPKLDDVINGYYEYKFSKNNHMTDLFAQISQRSCPYCGNLESNISKGIYGCSHCYSFNPALTKKVLQTYNNLTEYKGDFPKKQRDFKKLAQEIKDLSQQLQASVATEDYELAANLKEKIDELNMQVKN